MPKFEKSKLIQVSEGVIQPTLDSTLENLMYSLATMFINPNLFTIIVFMVNVLLVAILVYLKCRMVFLVEQSNNEALEASSTSCKSKKKPRRFHRHGI
ncbi:hypothetical protein BVE84_02310 [Streptococcus azizii]|uniref:Uncharacterized protein n=1 Tax=Streptococcus azizii TaxID=1579424 RepID=A0AB36JTL3_9STRE|nr:MULTISPECIES: hypothetical protein [Streptococcus]MBF0775362.1 hypothetical protein [Streptococcus sp. 19428wD3_AN2]ONK29631.1 hypothetical protein BVE86_01000 [Streptococcus azizii]ONK30139.1 hypothetical protein BVE85_02310 [Streptococcus azizii]ONK30915.1 hypothetical protein BVE84_02310 [Streptococcus azizii]TFU84885.1 hypothetical protein E4T83_01010 [Streptococcus sp. AN2]